MAVSTIGGSGDYLTLDSWCDAVRLIGTLTEDETGVLIDDSDYGDTNPAQGALDFSTVTLSGNTINLYADSTVTHKGVIGGGARIHGNPTNTSLFTPVENVNISDLEFRHTATGGFNQHTFNNVNNGVHKRLILINDRYDLNGVNFRLFNDAELHSSLCIGGDGGISVDDDAKVYNCTVIGKGTTPRTAVGLSPDQSPQMEVKNVWAAGYSRNLLEVQGYRTFDSAGDIGGIASSEPDIFGRDYFHDAMFDAPSPPVEWHTRNSGNSTNGTFDSSVGADQILTGTAGGLAWFTGGDVHTYKNVGEPNHGIWFSFNPESQDSNGVAFYLRSDSARSNCYIFRYNKSNDPEVEIIKRVSDSDTILDSFNTTISSSGNNIIFIATIFDEYLKFSVQQDNPYLSKIIDSDISTGNLIQFGAYGYVDSASIAEVNLFTESYGTDSGSSYLVKSDPFVNADSDIYIPLSTSVLANSGLKSTGATHDITGAVLSDPPPIGAYNAETTGTTINGTITQTLSALTQSASGAVADTINGSITQTLSALTQSATGDVVADTVNGSIVQTLPSLTQSATGTLVSDTINGTIVQTLTGITQSATGTLVSDTISGNITQTLTGITQSATGGVVDDGINGSIVQTLPSLTQSASGDVVADTISGDITQTLTGITQSASGNINDLVTKTINGSIVQTLPSLTQSATGTLVTDTRTGTIVQTLSGISQSATGIVGDIITGLPVASPSIVGRKVTIQTWEGIRVGKVKSNYPTIQLDRVEPVLQTLKIKEVKEVSKTINIGNIEYVLPTMTIKRVEHTPSTVKVKKVEINTLTN